VGRLIVFLARGRVKVCHRVLLLAQRLNVPRFLRFAERRQDHAWNRLGELEDRWLR